MSSLISKRILILLILILSIFSSNLNANGCKCKIAAKIKNDLSEYSGDKRDVYVGMAVKELRKEGTDICRFEALTVEINYEIGAGNTNLQSLLDKQIAIFSSLSCDSVILLDHFYFKAVNSFYQSDYENSAKFAYKALDFAERTNRFEDQVYCLKLLATILTQMGREDEANNITRKIVPVVDKMEKSKSKARFLIFIAEFYESLFLKEAKSFYIDSALIKTKESIRISQNYKYRSTQLTGYAYMNIFYNHIKNYNLSGIYLDSAFRFFNPSIDLFESVMLYRIKAKDEFIKGNVDKAEKAIDTCILYIRKYRPNTLVNHYSEFANMYAENGLYEKAFSFQSLAEKMKDSIITVENNAIISELEQKYQKAKNEKTIRELNQEKEIDSLRIRSLIYIIVGSVFLLLIIIFLYRQSVQKNKLKILETEQRLNRSRMNPHFLFNVLSNIQSLYYDKLQSDELPKYIGKFARIMRFSLESTYDELVSIDLERNFISQYLDLQILRFPDKFTYEMTIADEEILSGVQIPSMILQPFLENSIEHGFKNIDYPGIIQIHFSIENEHLLISIKDNGTINASTSMEKSHTSRATEIVKERLQLLSKKYKKKTDLKNRNDISKGYHIELSLPLIYPSQK